MTKRLKLTKLGDLVHRCSTMTSSFWWTQQWVAVNDAADQDLDWELMLTERIDGLTEMRDRFYELQPSTTEDR